MKDELLKLLVENNDKKVVEKESNGVEKNVEVKIEKNNTVESDTKADSNILDSFDEDDFNEDFSEDVIKEIYSIYGRKGSGKTFVALSWPGEKLVLSFDKKAYRTKKLYQMLFGEEKAKEIKIVDVLKYMDYTDENSILETSNKSWEYLNHVIKKYSGKFDWIIIDGTEILTQLTENVMRYKFGCSLYGGVKLQYWKMRKDLIIGFFNTCVSSSKKGVIYTTYTDKDEIIIDGEIVEKTEVPKWIEYVSQVTDVLIHTYKKDNRYYAKVVSSKLMMPEKTYDVTNKLFYEEVMKDVRG